MLHQPHCISAPLLWCPYICACIMALFILHNSAQAYQLKRHRMQKQN